MDNKPKNKAKKPSKPAEKATSEPREIVDASTASSLVVESISPTRVRKAREESPDEPSEPSPSSGSDDTYEDEDDEKPRRRGNRHRKRDFDSSESTSMTSHKTLTGVLSSKRTRDDKIENFGAFSKASQNGPESPLEVDYFEEDDEPRFEDHGKSLPDTFNVSPTRENIRKPTKENLDLYSVV